MRRLSLVIFSIIVSTCSNAQVTNDSNNNQQEEVEPYEYDTILKGGYTIYFKADDELEYIYLKKGNKIITELSSCSKGLPYKNLGYVATDFKDFFVLAHSFGSGNPHYIELIKKSTGENIIEQSAAWIDADSSRQMLLYCINDVPSAKDKMILYNIRTGQKQFFPFPADIFEDVQVLNRITIKKLSDKQLVIEYDTDKGSKKKTYSR